MRTPEPRPLPARRQFAIGDQVCTGTGQHLRIVQGDRHGAQDYVLELAVPLSPVDREAAVWRCGWERVNAATLLTAHALVWENEEFAYPWPNDGGDFWVRRLELATVDLPEAIRRTEAEAAAARARRNGAR